MVRATEIGCFMPSKQATDPQRERSSIMHASRVTCPSRSGRPPKPTLRLLMSDSVTRTPCSAASKALPPSESTFQAASFAATPCSQVEITIGPFVAGGVEDSNNSPARAGLKTDKAAPKAPNLKKVLLCIWSYLFSKYSLSHFR